MKACVTSSTVLTETTPPMPTRPPETLTATSVSPSPLGFGCSMELAQHVDLAAGGADRRVFHVGAGAVVHVVHDHRPRGGDHSPGDGAGNRLQLVGRCRRSTRTCSNAVTDEAAI